MDFVKDDELDYEEDSFEDDDNTKPGSQNFSHAKDKVNEFNISANKESDISVNKESDLSFNKESDMSGLDDQYLQIDFSEEEENFISDKIPLDSVSCENQNARKAGDKFEGSEKGQNISSEKEHFTRINNSGKVTENYDYHNGKTNEKFEKRSTPLRRQQEFNKKTKTSVGPQAVKKPREFSCNNQVLSLTQDFGSNRKPAFKLSNLDTTQQEQYSRHIRSINKTFADHFGLPFNSTGTEFTTQGRNIFSRNMRHKKFKPHLQDTNISNPSMFDRNLNISTAIHPKSSFDKLQISETSECLKRRASCDQKTSNIDRNRRESPNPLYNSLQEDEKQLLKLKKEARLKRFNHDDHVVREREVLERNQIKSASEFQESLQGGLHVLKGQKFGSENFLALKEQKNKNLISTNNRGGLPKVKPDINKELLLKKKNPFDKNVEISIHPPQNKIEYQKGEAKEGCVKSRLQDSVTIQQELVTEGGKTEEEGVSNDALKSAVNSHVNFVRTVSKSFDELVLKTRPRSQSSIVKTLPFSQLNKSGCLN